MIVLAPGNYSTFTVEYTLLDNGTHQGGTITKTYNNITLNAGKNKRVVADLQVPDYTSWDNRNMWYASTTSNCPNVNEMLYYMMNGDPRLDNSLWSFHGQLYRGGIWLKKQSVIYSELKAAGYSMLTTQAAMKERFYSSAADITGSDQRVSWVPGSKFGVLASTPPVDKSKYFFLPALGAASPTDYEPGTMGAYWSSSLRPNWGGYEAIFLSFAPSSNMIGMANNTTSLFFASRAFE